METFTDSLSFGDHSVVNYNKQTTEQTIVPYTNSSAETSLFTERSPAEEFSFNSALLSSAEVPNNQLTEANPLILADRNKALATIQSLLSAAQVLKQTLFDAAFGGPICPYEKTLVEYLGPNFICPTIQELALPQNFSVQSAVSSISVIGEQYNKTMLTQLDVMSAEAADMSFPGITSQHLGNAFAVLSTTTNGEEFVVDREKTARHLEFAEIVRNIPIEYIIDNPIVVAQKLIARYTEINQD